MRICMVVSDLQEFGGLEEIVTSLVIDLQRKGHQVSVLSTTWTSFENQYLRRLQQNEIRVVQPPKQLSLVATDWPTKQRLLASAMWLLSPLVWILAVGLRIGRDYEWVQAKKSARGWLQGELFTDYIGPDRQKPIATLLLRWWSRRWKPDLLHIHGYPGASGALLYAVDWASLNQIPVLYELHQTPDTSFYEWKDFRNNINKADRIIAVSEKSAESLRDIVGAYRPIVVIGPVVLDPASSGRRDWSRLVDPGGPIEITTVARLFHTKGLNYLLEAIAKVTSEYADVNFSIYGDGSLRHELLEHAASLGLNGEDIFVGTFTTREQLTEIMEKTDIFAMSSLLEGQPLAIVEAMAHGRPIVATAVGGIPELITDGTNGLLCKPREPSCLAENIIRLIEDPSLRARLGTAARNSYECGPFQPAIVAQQFISLYQQVLDERQDSAHSTDQAVTS